MLDAVMCDGETASEVVARFATGASESIADVVADVMAKATDMQGRSAETLERWGMGVAMRRLVGRADPKEVRRALSTALAPMTEVAS